MNKPDNGRNRRSDVVATSDDRDVFVAKPSLYASIVETESRLRQVSLSRLQPKPITTRVRIVLSARARVNQVIYGFFVFCCFPFRR